MFLGIVVGVGSRLGAVVFRELILGATRAFTGFSDHSSAQRVPNPRLPALVECPHFRGHVVVR